MRKSELPRSILIVRLEEPAEIIISSPIARALKANYPNTKIHYVTLDEHSSAAKCIKDVDHILKWKRPKHNSNYLIKSYNQWKQLKNLKGKLSKLNIDTCIDLEGSMLSGAIAYSSGAKQRVGLNTKESNNFFMTKTISRIFSDTKQIGSEYRYLIDQLGLSHDDWKMSAPTGKKTSASARQKIREAIGSEKFAIICPSTDTDQKGWKNEYWQQITLRIRGKYQLRCIILGNQSDYEKNERLAHGCGAINLSGKLSLPECSEAIRQSKIVIGADNYFTHVAVALKQPSLALFGPTCPYTFTEDESSRIIYKNKQCSPCEKTPSCGGSFHCMTDISPDQVLTEIKPLLTNRR